MNHVHIHMKAHLCILTWFYHRSEQWSGFRFKLSAFHCFRWWEIGWFGFRRRAIVKFSNWMVEIVFKDGFLKSTFGKFIWCILFFFLAPFLYTSHPIIVYLRVESSTSLRSTKDYAFHFEGKYMDGIILHWKFICAIFLQLLINLRLFWDSTHLPGKTLLISRYCDNPMG